MRRFTSAVIAVALSHGTAEAFSRVQEIDARASRTYHQVAERTALQKMEIAFVGNPSQARIQPLLDRALSLYGFQINNDRYERVGSVLVAMRKEFGTSEMQILECLTSDTGLANRATLPEAAVLCAAKYK